MSADTQKDTSSHAGSEQTAAQEPPQPSAADRAREKILKEKSARLHALCHQMAQGLNPQDDMAARWEAYWICGVLGWDQMQSGQDWLGAAEGKLWRFKTQGPWKAFQEALAFSGSAPLLGVKPDDADALLSDDGERARVMVTWVLPVLLGDPGEDQKAFCALDNQAALTAAQAFSQAMGLGDDAKVACAAQLLDPRKLRLLAQDGGGLRAFWSTLAQPSVAPEAAAQLTEALTFENPHEHRWPALAWVVFGFWPKDAASSHKIFAAMAPKLGPGCARGLDEAQEAASAVFRAALKTRQEELSRASKPAGGEEEQKGPQAAAGASRLEQLDAQAQGLAEFALFPPMPMGFALQTQEALAMMLPTAAQLAARAMKRQGVESVGWVASETVAEKDEDAWKKGAVWALGREGAPAVWNPSAWLDDMKGPDEMTPDWRARIEASFAAEGLKWRAPMRLKASHADALMGNSKPANAQDAAAVAASQEALARSAVHQPLTPKAAQDLALGELGLLDPRAMGAESGALLSKKPPKASGG